MTFYLEQKQDLSVYYYTKDFLHTDLGATFVTVVDEYPSTEVKKADMPVVAVENEFYFVKPLEMGNRYGYLMRTWYITIFGKNKSQRDDFGYGLVNKYQSNIPVYDFEEGFPPPYPTQIGAMVIDEISYKPMKVHSELVEDMYWRGEIKIVAHYSRTTT